MIFSFVSFLLYVQDDKKDTTFSSATEFDFLQKKTLKPFHHLKRI